MVPSVLYGVFGLAVIVPFLQNNFGLAKGQSLIAVILVLAIMMLPTVVTVSETAIKAVPKTYREGSLALGSSEIRTIFRVVVPAANVGNSTDNDRVRDGGELLVKTMAVIKQSLLQRVLPTVYARFTTNIALEMGYAAGTHQEMLFATGIGIIFFILLLNFVLAKISSKGGN